LDHPLLFAKGWWDVERDNAAMWRWTDGDAVFLLPDAGPTVLEITLASSLDYPVARDVETRGERHQGQRPLRDGSRAGSLNRPSVHPSASRASSAAAAT
jgi:hypothetical protein